MGMGEPMANERNVFASVSRITDPHGMRLGARHVTVSTVGMIPGIDRLATAHPQVGLAVSFHAADDGLRSELVPANRLWPLRDLEAAMSRWRDLTRRRPSIEWAMIDGVNDSALQADLLAPIARRLGAHVNLIPLNPTPGWPTRPSPKRRIGAFTERLRAAGVNVTIRDTRGRTIDAACGQLRLEHDRRIGSGTSPQNPLPVGKGLPPTVR
jgi:23S rRNA (adenine2503-C2)-methyltransferase